MGRQAKLTFTIGQVEEISKVKSHVLRYWDEVIPGFAPQKDAGGRREYTFSQLEKIFRLNYLIKNKSYSIEAAVDKIISDADFVSNNPEFFKELHDLRRTLVILYFESKKLRG